MTARKWQVMVFLAVAIVFVGAAGADDEDTAAKAPMNFVTTVDFSNMQTTSIEGTVGEVDVKSVEFVASNVKGGIQGTFSSADSEIQVVITTTIACSTSSDTKWKLDFLVEFLDENGDVIDRVVNNGSLKNNDKAFDFKHTTLKWAIAHIKQARVSVAAKQ